jgi:hypothetical protein
MKKCKTKILIFSLASLVTVFVLLSKSITAEKQDSNVHDSAKMDSKYIINDLKFYPVPQIQRPTKGVTFQDPIFHMKITRITDASTEVPGRRSSYAQSGYPKHDIENADGTMLIIQSYSGSTWHIWNARPPYNKIKDIPSKLIGWGRKIDTRWDSKDPNALYLYQDTRFFKYEVNSDKLIMLYDFKNDFEPLGNAYISSIGMAEEGTPSDDSRYWAFRVTYHNPVQSPKWRREIYVVYDKDFHGKDNGKIISKLQRDNPLWREAGFISMSPSGKYVWMGDRHYLYTRDFAEIRALNLHPGHADMAINDEGREVVFGFVQYQNSNWSAMVDIETGAVTRLAKIGVPGYHFSGNAYSKPGWGVVSTYLPAYPGQEKNWGDHEVYMIELTNRKNPAPRTWRIAHTHTVLKGYPDAPFAKINRRGTKIWFGSGWGNSYKDGSYDVYQIDLPDTWYEDLMGNRKPLKDSSSPTGKSK